MGISDRDYAYESRGRFGVGRLNALSANTWIIVVNVAVHLVSGRLMGNPGGKLFEYGYFSTAKVLYDVKTRSGLEFWRFITFQFLHAPGLMHLGMNMLGLYIFGALVEQHLGPKRYCAFYLTCGIFGGLMYLLLNALGLLFQHWNLPTFLLLNTNAAAPLVGASAGVFGVIMACAYLSPDSMIDLLFPPVSLRMKTLAYGYVAIALVNLLFGGRNAGGDAAHVGGAIAGYFFIRRSHLLRDFFDVLGDSRKPRERKLGRNGPKLRLVGNEPAPGPSEEELNRLLDKVSESGIESLNPAEKEALRKATQARRTRES